MKTLVVVLLLLLPTAAAAQEAPKDESHGVSVVKSRWQKRVYNPALDEDPMNASDDAADVIRARQEAVRVSTRRAEQQQQQRGRPPLPPPADEPKPKFRPGSGRVEHFYVYEVTLSNTGTKKIRAVVWEYVLLDAATQAEVGRHEFESKTDIGVGKSKSLLGESSMPPASVIHVSKSDKETREQYAERVDIRRVVYEDGTVWERGRH